MSDPGKSVWPAFVWAVLAMALTAGFGLGAALFLTMAAGLPAGRWWPAAAQAHGHAQLFGWAGLMVLGVGLHFLPRLRGAPAPRPAVGRGILLLLLTGLVLRPVTQPLSALSLPDAAARVARLGLGLSGLLEIAGGSVALVALARLRRRGPPPDQRSGFRPVQPFFLAGFAGWWLALGVNLAGLALMGETGDSLFPNWADRLVVELGLYAFLIPVSIAMSVRTFPLFLRTHLPRARALAAGLGIVLAALAARIAGELAEAPVTAGLGELGLALGLGVFVLALGAFGRRRPLPRRPVRPFHDAVQWHAWSAYGWLALTSVLLALSGGQQLLVGEAGLPPETEWHTLGAGFVTLLILGVGARMLPGFAGRPLRSARLLWLTLAFGNAAALLRVAPLLFPGAGLPPSSLLMASAGVSGWLAIAIFGWNTLVPSNVPGRTRGPQFGPISHPRQ